MSKYIILEVQSNADGTVGTIITTYDESEKDSAESKYHLILSSAAVSSLPRHTAFMLKDDGRIIRSECYEHPIEPTPDPESVEPEGGEEE